MTTYDPDAHGRPRVIGTITPEGGEWYPTIIDAGECELTPCGLRWPAAEHFSDHVCDLPLGHEGDDHHCERCDRMFDFT